MSYLLDISRLVSRAGRVPTGVDRVEFAYLNYLIPRAAFGLARTALGFVLLDAKGMAALASCITANDWGDPDLVSRANPRLSAAARRGQSFVRRHAVARCSRLGLAGMLARHFPNPIRYYNVGHSNLTARVLSAIKAQSGARINVLLHDTIPLDWPAFQRPGTVPAFAAKLRLVAQTADRVICTSQACQSDVARHLTTFGRVPPLQAAALGVPIPVPGPMPPELRPSAPYFVMLGTIEPRKNHAMILDVWQALGPQAPQLVIAGGRGWNNAAVFDRLEQQPPQITEAPGLSDPAIATLLQGSAGLLFPSLAEGFGLPPVEAAALGVPVICADLPVCREILGNWPVYLDPNDGYQWQNTITRQAAEKTPTIRQAFEPPTWDSHFKLVFSEA